jgi:hypothetical protein
VVIVVPLLVNGLMGFMRYWFAARERLLSAFGG